jgi:hypothetical protein
LNAVEIEEAISQLVDQTFDPENFPYAFLEAFGNTTLEANGKMKSTSPISRAFLANGRVAGNCLTT